MFDLQNLSVAYQNAPVLKNISLCIAAQEKVALVGPSGAGKTTLLLKLYELGGARCAFVHQHFALVPQLSAFHNVYMGRLDQYRTSYNLLNLLRPQTREVEEISRIMKQLGLEEKLFQRTGTLSGGQQQRIALARAIYRQSEVILADEPVSSIDPHQAAQVLETLLGSARTVILSLHSVQLALQFAQRIIGLRQGQIFFDLPSQEVSHELLAALYRPLVETRTNEATLDYPC